MVRSGTARTDVVRPRLARPVPGEPCDLVTVPAREGLEAADILRLWDGVGPVLHDGGGTTLGFLVPPGTADGWDVPGSACARASMPPGRAVDAPPVPGARWLVPPERAYVPATDPALLRAALREAAHVIDAADRQR
ncbi:hypothetical protein [Streptomyces sp. JJ38]|uniref:hypothetical protein n=1 Tax=Streptomyces sp. JJ38 TaxID=2738128 RepID=UPI0035B1F361